MDDLINTRFKHKKRIDFAENFLEKTILKMNLNIGKQRNYFKRP